MHVETRGWWANTRGTNTGYYQVVQVVHDDLASASVNSVICTVVMCVHLSSHASLFARWVLFKYALYLSREPGKTKRWGTMHNFHEPMMIRLPCCWWQFRYTLTVLHKKPLWTETMEVIGLATTDYLATYLYNIIRHLYCLVSDVTLREKPHICMTQGSYYLDVSSLNREAQGHKLNNYYYVNMWRLFS